MLWDDRYMFHWCCVGLGCTFCVHFLIFMTWCVCVVSDCQCGAFDLLLVAHGLTLGALGSVLVCMLCFLSGGCGQSAYDCMERALYFVGLCGALWHCGHGVCGVMQLCVCLWCLSFSDLCVVWL